MANAQPPELSDAFENFQDLYGRGLYREALPFAEKAATLSEKALGPDDPEVADSLENCAEVLAHAGRPDEANKYLARAEAVREHSPNRKRA